VSNIYPLQLDLHYNLKGKSTSSSKQVIVSHNKFYGKAVTQDLKGRRSINQQKMLLIRLEKGKGVGRREGALSKRLLY
jgi:hypothetical protein